MMKNYILATLVFISSSAYAQRVPPIPGLPGPVGAPIVNPYLDRSVPQKAVGQEMGAIDPKKEEEITSQDLEAFENLTISSIVPGRYAKAQIVMRSRTGAVGTGASTGVSMGGMGQSASGASSGSTASSQMLMTIPHKRVFLYKGKRLIAEVESDEVSIYLSKDGKKDVLMWTGQLSGVGTVQPVQTAAPYSPPMTAGKPLTRDSTASSTSGGNSSAGSNNQGAGNSGSTANTNTANQNN